VRLDVAMPGRENEVELACRALQLPLAKRVEHHGRQGNGPLARFRLRRADRAVTIGALANVKLALLEIDVLPTKGAKLGSAKAPAGLGPDPKDGHTDVARPHPIGPFDGQVAQQIRINLVARVTQSAGYSLLSFTRAWSVVNCQSALA
jgi:hypothetical protein